MLKVRSCARQCRLALLAVGSLLALTGAAAALDPSGAERLERALRAGDEGAWSFAEKLASEIGDPLAEDIVEWRYLSEGEPASFDRYVRFLDRHPGWPRLNRIRLRAEGAIGDGDDPARVRTFFAERGPQSPRGKIRYGEALIAAGERSAATPHLRAAWRTGAFSVGDEEAFLARHGALLSSEDHAIRLDTAIWDGRYSEARRMRPRVSDGSWRLADARLKLRGDEAGVDAAVARVPASLQGDPGLAYDRLRWRHNRERYDDAAAILMDEVAVTGHRSAWWRMRSWYIRRALADREWTRAYRLAARHEQIAGEGFAEAEWLAGWIALRYIRQPDLALGHFERMWANVGRPISRSRAAYWAGRAAEARGDAAATKRWYGRAAEHHIAFYGQLALEKLGYDMPALRAMPSVDASARAEFERKEGARAARMLIAADESAVADDFVGQLGEEAVTVRDLALVAGLAQEAGRPDLLVRIGKEAMWRGLVVEPIAFPVPAVSGFEARRGADGADAELVLALSRQESEFKLDVVSRAGAAGLMQLMPGTARLVAARLGLPYSASRVLSDPAYNVALGRAYIGSQLEAFGDPVLAIAAYNAGPGRVNEWLGTIGDPRTGAIDRLDWIELLPFAETRNYVQRVLENRMLYRRLLADGSVSVVERAADDEAGPDVPTPLAKPEPS
ncbi:transglycosylase SLT domain-containing protein [Marinivivus vitaminiproducens]|uniref:lytic transglycosylase domain-containing protein n=1 Tax=Marinivivus vitaminiproducens TaxID=3035935 RepID=UPI0027A3A689|nr:lytic transglycosylase domain-containing protein [Geminicoccaceae bacterium SCSIO 64248]